MKNKSKLTGKPIDICALNLALYGKTDPDSVNISPEEMKKLWSAVMPTLRNHPKQGIIIVGSSAESKNANFFKQLWENENRN